MSLRTPLGQARGLGSAKDGTEHWWLQRVTAVALVPLVLVLLYYMIRLLGADHAQVVAALGHPVAAVLLILLFIAAFLHLKLGLQVVIEDYVHGAAAKLTLLLLNTFGRWILALIGILAVLKLAFGG